MSLYQADIDALADPDPYVRAAAAERLGEARCTEALVPLIGTMHWRQEDVEDEIEGRTAAVIALGQLGDPRAIPPLLAFLQSSLDEDLEEVSLTCDVMESLAKLQASDALPLLERAVCSAEYDVVKTAVLCLRQYPADDTIVVLLRAAANPGAIARDVAVEELGLLRDARAIPLLVPLLDDVTANDWLRGAAAAALGRIGGTFTFDLLLAAFLDAGLSENVWHGVTRGLGYLADPRAFAPLTQALRTSEWPIFLLEALGNLRDLRAVPILIDYLRDRRATV
ncbi:MAG: HEAT repeat domain-containing protein, partial [Bryobacterales bacterium]|nr:HEAT repeat domain-containing protein [Bryobacterales bacterium]